MIWKCWCSEGCLGEHGCGVGQLLLEGVTLVSPVLALLQPDTLGALPNLRELWLDRNQLSALPPVSEGRKDWLHPLPAAL